MKRAIPPLAWCHSSLLRIKIFLPMHMGTPFLLRSTTNDLDLKRFLSNSIFITEKEIASSDLGQIVGVQTVVFVQRSFTLVADVL